jgi:hypothetical protein
MKPSTIGTIMNTALVRFFFAILFAVLLSPANGQPSVAQCVANIQKRLDVLGNQTDFDFLKAREIMKDFDFGKVPNAVADPQKAAAFKRVFTSLSEFCDAAGKGLSAKGMNGYTKQSGLLINSSDLTKTEGNIAKLKEAFTHGGNFKGADFDGVMAKLGDSTKFDFDGATGTFTSKASGAKYAKHPTVYAQGEPDSITHIMRGHTTNAFTDALTGQKSLFADPSKVLDLIDDAMKLPASSRTSLGGGAFWVDLGKAVGTDINGAATTKIRIVIRGGTTDVIHTAFPH